MNARCLYDLIRRATQLQYLVRKFLETNSFPPFSTHTNNPLSPPLLSSHLISFLWLHRQATDVVDNEQQPGRHVCGYLLRAIQVCKVYAILKRIAGINNGEFRVSQNKLSKVFLSTFIIFIVPLLLYHNSCTNLSVNALHNFIKPTPDC